MTSDLRSLDRLVAEKVMGWPMKTLEVVGGNGATIDLWCLPNGDQYAKWDLPMFSSDVGDAWLVVERMREKRRDSAHRPFSVELLMGAAHACRITDWGVEGETVIAQVVADTIPEAICRAALRAVGEAE